MLVGGLVAFGAYKMSTRDADRIEQHTGISPEEMTDEELEQAMDELGIEKQSRTAQDVEEASGGGDAADEIDHLKKLAELHEQGVLTDEEFQARKAQILGLE